MESSTMEQEMRKKAKPLKEHQWLDQLLGEWAVEGEMTMGPDQPLQKWKGVESVRSLGGLWIIAEGQNEMPDGMTGSMITQLGYDPQKKQFVGTFTASVMTNLWLYSGTLDASRKILTLETEGPNMVSEGKLARYKDIIEIKNEDHRLLTSQMLGEDGKWRQFMTAHYRRKK
jgi:hypothetical protein